jgi:hypothetical protein
LVGVRPDIILTNGTPATAALQRETRTIPIVFAAVDPKLGFPPHRVVIPQIGMTKGAARLISNHGGVAQMGYSTYEAFADIVAPLAGVELMAKFQSSGFI